MTAELYSDRLIGKDLEGSGRGLNELHRHFPGGNGETTNKPPSREARSGQVQSALASAESYKCTARYYPQHHVSVERVSVCGIIQV